MLKYRINKNNVISDEDRIVINRSQILDIDLFDDEQYYAKNSVICYTNDLNQIQIGTKLIAYHTLYSTFNEDGQSVYNFDEEYKVDEINEANSSFSFLVNKYTELPLRIISKSKEFEVNEGVGENVEYLYMYFENPHFFSEDEEEVNMIQVLYNNEWYIMDDFEILSNSSIRFKWGDIKEEYGFFNTIIGESMNDDITLLRVFRENYYFTYSDNFTIYYNNPKCKINIPLSNTSQTGLLKEQSLNDYVADAKARSINGIVDMEKDIYYPVYKNLDDEIDYLTNIKFNLHFREHRGDNWTVEPDSYWNGMDKEYVKVKDGEDEKTELSNLKPIDDFFSYDNKEEQSDLLSYLGFTDSDVRYQKNRLKKSFLRLSFYDSMNTGNQNLLATSTIFMNSGQYFNKYIRYIEETPYRSLTYTEDGDLKEVVENLTGIKVNREYGKKDNNKGFEHENSEEHRLSSQFVITDKYSSTASSEGFYLYLWRDLLTNLSDEQKQNGLDIYMKVEFNHAGYGRNIPFMMPYWDKKKWGDKKKSIKTFNNIIDDWNTGISSNSKLSEVIITDKEIYTVYPDKNDEQKKYITIDGGEIELEQNGDSYYCEIDNKKFYTTIRWNLNDKLTDGEYGARQYDKFSYIHFKINYDENEKKYIYYLDSDCYGDGSVKNACKNNTLTLNLYEVKMV